MITRVWGEKAGKPRHETLIYIGKAGRTFKERLKDHTGYWIPELRGNLYVRYAELKADDATLEDLESALICASQPQENMMKKQEYTFRTNYLYRITNRGCGNVLPRVVDAAEQFDAYENDNSVK